LKKTVSDVKKCQKVCPYSELKVAETELQYSVISYNNWTVNSQAFWKDNNTAIINGGTSTPKEMTTLAGAVPPFKNEYFGETYSAVRPRDVVEKCVFCNHRIKNGEKPYCVVSCPSGARTFGDLNDANSEINKVLANGYRLLKNNKGEFLAEGEKGTQPNFFYVGDFSIATPVRNKEIKSEVNIKVYPNPIRDISNLKFSLSEDIEVYASVIDLTGRTLLFIVEGEWYPQGKHTIQFNVQGLKNGQYIVSLQTRKTRITTNILVAK